ncbi:MAG: hypothetical protein KUL88_11900 [Rhizobium sp.]|nr:hypothetical protein [Rhizobium sp.]
MRKIFAFMMFGFLISCGQEDVSIEAGYRYFEIDGGNFAIVDKDNHMVVHPNVIQYETRENYIIGKREKPKFADDVRFSRKFGYFALDISSGKLVEGLSKTDLDDFISVHTIR